MKNSNKLLVNWSFLGDVFMMVIQGLICLLKHEK